MASNTFFRPSKVILGRLVLIFIIVNLIISIFVFWYGKGFFIFFPLVVAMAQVGWLVPLFNILGIDTLGRCNEMVCNLNEVGITAILVNLLITIFIYYVLACVFKNVSVKLLWSIIAVLLLISVVVILLGKYLGF